MAAKLRWVLCALPLLLFANVSSAAVVSCYSEFGDFCFPGDPADPELSGDNGSPTDLGQFLVGMNVVRGEVTSVGDEGTNGTADIFTFEIPQNMQLDTVFMTAFSTDVGDAVFLALDDGPTFQFSSEEINNEPVFGLPDLTQILGGLVLGTNEVGTDILDNLSNTAPFNGAGFTTPLGAGQYSVYIQETGPRSDYTLTFNVSAVSVPEPSTMAGLGVLSAGVAARSWRKRKKRSASKKA